MMRALLAFSLVAVSNEVSAQTVPTQSRVEIIGEALPACQIRGGANTEGSNVSFQSAGPFAGDIRILQLVDPTTAVPLNANIQLQVPVVCNGPHRLILRSAMGGLVRDGVPANVPSRFRERLPYEFSALWDGQILRRSSDAEGPFVVSSAEGRAENLDVSITVTGGGLPLVAGTYSDTITVEFQAAN